jgi:pimeloyl-ACP methyl ester carboxylesterase
MENGIQSIDMKRFNYYGLGEIKKPLCFLFSLLLLMTSIPPQAHAQAAPLPRFEAGPCPVDFSGVKRKIDCGLLYVAENRKKPTGRIVALPVAIARASVPNPKADPGVFLHGGPGGYILDRVAAILQNDEQAENLDMPMFTKDRDWYFFDQRGAGLAQPNLDCGAVRLNDLGLAADNDIDIMEACRKRLVATGVDLSQYNAEIVAQDIADLRRAVGFDRYNLYGISYGSLIAFAVQKYAPEGLRAIVHDAPVPPEAKLFGPLPDLLTRELALVLKKCDAVKACGTRFKAIKPRLDKMAAQWAVKPHEANGQTYTVDDLAGFLMDATYDFEGVSNLPRDLDRIIKGNMAALDTYMQNRSYYFEGQNFTHMCKEEMPFEDAALIRANTQKDPITAAIARMALRNLWACKTWNTGQTNPRDNEPVKSSIPTLLIASEIDAGCPAEYAYAAAKHLPNSHVVVVPNETHGATERSKCARSIMARFLDNPDAAVDQSCIKRDDKPIPFALK